MAKVKLNKADLVTLLKDEEVKEQLKLLIVELFGEDKWKMLSVLLEGLLNDNGSTETEDEPVVKEPWYKKLFKWATIIVPFVLKFFGKKK